MGNVMLLKPFETSLSEVKGEVKVKKAEITQSQISKFQNEAARCWLSHAYICRNGS